MDSNHREGGRFIAEGELGDREQAGANSMTLEHAPADRRAFFTSFTLSGTQAGLILVDLVSGESHGSFLWLVTAEGIDTLTSAPDANGAAKKFCGVPMGREIFGARRVTSATFARSLQQFGRRALVDLVALMGNYAGTAALLTAFDMQLDPGQPQPLPPL